MRPRCGTIVGWLASFPAMISRARGPSFQVYRSWLYVMHGQRLLANDECAIAKALHKHAVALPRLRCWVVHHSSRIGCLVRVVLVRLFLIMVAPAQLGLSYVSLRIV